MDPIQQRQHILMQYQSDEFFKRFQKAPYDTTVIQLVEEVHVLAGQLAQEQLATYPPQVQHSCKAGCVICCHTRVTVTAPEIFVIIEWMRKNLDEPQIRQLRDDISEVRMKVNDRTEHGRWVKRIACPLLDKSTNSCIVYEVRPLTCRGFHSLDVRGCQDDFDSYDKSGSVTYDGNYKAIFSGLADGLFLGAVKAGIPAQFLELIAALDIALASPNPATEWLSDRLSFDNAEAQ